MRQINEILSFRTNLEEYALDIKAIKGIIKCQKLTEVALRSLARIDQGMARAG